MAKKRKKPKMEFRYYQMPAGSPILALLGQKWVQNYGNDVDYLHFHNYPEIGFCYEGDGVMAFGEAKMRFSGREFTVIPPNYAHTTNSDLGTVSKWEYLFIDVEGFMKKFLNNPVKAEKMIQRIYSKALFLKENESPSIAAKILKIMNIMREGEEFYIEESSGNCQTEPGFTGRQGGRGNRETYKYDHPRTGFCFLSLYGGYPDRGSGEDLPYQ